MRGQLLRAAIIGTGRIGSLLERDPLRSKPHTHAGWYASHPDVALVAGADVNPERLAAFSDDWRVPPEQCYADYRELLVRERPDLVSICAYAPERVEMARAAIDAGARGLWLEKAVGCSMAEVGELRALAEAAGVAVVVNHPRRVDPAHLAVRDLIVREELGRLESVHCLFSGHFIHTGTHAWDLLDEWCGPWAEVRGWPACATAPDGSPADLTASATVSTVPTASVGAESGWAAVRRGGRGDDDPGGVAHIVFANGVHAFVSGSPKRYFVFQADLVFAAGRIQVGNDVRRVFRPASSSRYEGFVELEESGDPLPAALVPASTLDALVTAVATGHARLDSLDAAIRALHLGLAVVRALETAGRPVQPGDISPDFRAASI